MPGARPSRRYAPPPSASAERVEPPSRLEATTSAPGSAVPSLEVTPPWRVAVVACAASDDAAHAASDDIDRNRLNALRPRSTALPRVCQCRFHLAPPASTRKVRAVGYVPPPSALLLG